MHCVFRRCCYSTNTNIPTANTQQQKTASASDPVHIKIHNNQAVIAYTPRFSEARSKPVIVIGNGSLLNLTFICRGVILTEKQRVSEGADSSLLQDSTA